MTDHTTKAREMLRESFPGAVLSAEQVAPLAALIASEARMREAQTCIECGGPPQWRCPACRIAQSQAVADPPALEAPALPGWPFPTGHRPTVDSDGHLVGPVS